MRLRQDPNLVRRARSVRATRNEIAHSLDDPVSLPQLLHQNVAKNAALFLAVVILTCSKLMQNPPWHERARGQLRTRMREVLPCHRSMILKNGDVLEPLVFFQVLNALRGQPEEAFDLYVARVP